ncbi:MAG TPA: DUF2723 domain-containing protein [Acidobacteriota bacterium]|nr:DUF2723 domain-containing protein [Acidobacteriota bacterium]
MMGYNAEVMARSIEGKLPFLIFLTALGFYLYTVAPVVTFVDSGELAAVVGTRGVAHPTGFPLYLLLSSVFAAIPLGTLIVRLNIFSALCAAASIFFTYLIFIQIFKSIPAKKHKKSKQKQKASEHMELPMIWAGGCAAALAWMCNRALWNTATVTEVYSLHALMIAIFTYCLISATRTSGARSTRYLGFAVLTAGLAAANYPPFAILAPAVLFYLYRKPPENMRFKTALWLGLLMLGGLLPYILLPIRAKSDPLLNWGNPSNWELFWNHVSAAQYKVFLGKPDFGNLLPAIELWRHQWPLPIWLLIIPGVIYLFRLQRSVFYFTLITGITNILYVLSYDITDVASAPSDYYAYLLPLCWASAIWIGAGLQWIIISVGNFVAVQLVYSTISIVLILLIPVLSAYASWDDSDRREYFYADDFARSILVSLPPNSIVLTHDWTFVSPSLYLQHVENLRSDVVVLDTELLRRSWYFKYLTKRASWLQKQSELEISAFMTELSKYERGLPYDGNVITEKYVIMLNKFIAAALRTNHPPHILLNLEAKELNVSTYRNWERTLGRPPFVTVGVMPNAIGAGYQWVPESLAFRLYEDVGFHELPEIEIPPRKIQADRKYDAVTLGVFARYAEFWRWRGDYLKTHENCSEAIQSYDRALQINPRLEEVKEGLSACVQKALS